MKTLKIDVEKLAEQYGFELLTTPVIYYVDDEDRYILELQGEPIGR